jgi:CRP-like cAMP-binding protein
MADFIESTKTILTKKKYNSELNSDHLLIDIALSPEDNLKIILNKDISNNLKYISKIKIVYELLIKLKNFKEFIMLYNIEQKLMFQLLSIGILKSFKKDECINNKGCLAEHYFLVLFGAVFFQSLNQEYLPGNFFGEKYLIYNKKYRTSIISNKDNTILLLIPKDFFINNLKNKIMKGNDRVRIMILKSFKIFNMIERKTLEKYFQKMIKLFPSPEEIIISNNEVADSIYLIYEGSCALSNEKQGDLLILEKGDIFGNESLYNINDNKTIMKNRYKYNIVNKSQNTIIFKFFINDLSKYLINGMKTYLASYFLSREEIIKNSLHTKKVIKNIFKKEYDLFKRPINKKEMINNFCFNNNIITNEKIQKSFNHVLSEIRFKRKEENFNKKLIPCMSNFVNKNTFLIQKFLQNNKIKSSSNSKTNIEELNSKYLNSNKSKKEIRKILWFSEKKENNNKNKKNKKHNNFLNNNSNFNYSSKILTFTDNNNNNNSNLYLTSINQVNKNNNNIFNIKDNIFKVSQKNPFYNKEGTITTESSINQNRINKRFINSAFSTNLCSISNKNNSKILSVREQIETYGCTILETMSYFNDGINDKFLKRNYSANTKRRITNNKKNLFYQTQKYNIPLYVLCDKREKRKFPDITNF